MNEFIKKLIERLEELYDRNDKSKKDAYEEQDWERFDLFTHRNEGIYTAISIVNQLAEEYSRKHVTNDLAVVESLPSLYPLQPFEEEAIHRVVDVAKKISVSKMETVDWIPCSERLPEEHGEYLVWWTDLTQNEYYEITEYHPAEGWIGDIPQAVEGKYTVIAWQPLPAPYQPEGE